MRYAHGYPPHGDEIAQPHTHIHTDINLSTLSGLLSSNFMCYPMKCFSFLYFKLDFEIRIRYAVGNELGSQII